MGETEGIHVRMGAAAYVGRVGGLAVALGIGAAMVTSHGLASADPTGESGAGATTNSSAHSMEPSGGTASAVATSSSVAPRARTLTIPLEQVAHTLDPGETVTLQLIASAGTYETIASLGVLNVASIQLALPTAANAMAEPSPLTIRMASVA